MTKWVRRLRGAIGMGLTWAAAWFAAGMILLLIVGPDAADVPFPLGFGLLGFFAGATFSAVVGLAEGRRRFDEMSLPRFTMWGGIGGVLLSTIFVLVTDVGADLLLVLGPVFGFAGAASAAGTLALARRVEDRAMLDAGEDEAEAGITGREARELPGDATDRSGFRS